MIELKEFSSLLDAIYGAAMDDTRWKEVSSRIARTFGTHSCVLQVRASGRTVMLGNTENVTPALLHEYEDHYYRTDDWVKGATRMQCDAAYLSSELVAESVLRRSEHYEFITKADMFYVAGALLSVGLDELGIIGVHHDFKSGDFDEGHRRQLQALVPHLRQALQMRSMFIRNTIQRDLALGSLDGLASAVILTDATGKVLYANRAAVAMLRQEDGLREREGRICTNTPATTRTILHLIGKASSRKVISLRPDMPYALTLQRSRRAPLPVQIASVRAGDLSAIRDIPMAMLIAQDTEHVDASRLEVLQAMFSVTPAEAWLAGKLASGCSLEEAARSKGVGMNTVRTQLKSLFLKTGTRRQGELVAFILKQAGAFDRN
jgi:DNA-binding CsgD family transcriptional regulator